MDLRGAPASELEAIRRHAKSVQPYMVVAQHVDDRLSDEAPQPRKPQRGQEPAHGRLVVLAKAHVQAPLRAVSTLELKEEVRGVGRTERVDEVGPEQALQQWCAKRARSSGDADRDRWLPLR